MTIKQLARRMARKKYNNGLDIALYEGMIEMVLNDLIEQEIKDINENMKDNSKSPMLALSIAVEKAQGIEPPKKKKVKK